MDQYGRTGIAAHLKSVMRTMVNVDIKSNSFPISVISLVLQCFLCVSVWSINPATPFQLVRSQGASIMSLTLGIDANKT